MKKLFSLIILFTSITVFAIEVPVLTDRVVDNANMFTTSQKQIIINDILNFEKATSGQFVVLTIPSLNGDSLEEFSIKTAEKWQIGHKGKDNGILFILVKNDKEIRIEVGYGYEGYVNDAKAGDVIRSITPLLKEQKYSEATVKAIGYIQAYVTSDTERQPESSGITSGEIWAISIIIAVLLIISLLIKTNDGCLLLTIIICLAESSGKGGSRKSSGGFGGGGGGFGGGGASGKW